MSLLCVFGIHEWGGVIDGLPGAWRCCARCDKYQEFVFENGFAPSHWHTVDPTIAAMIAENTLPAPVRSNKETDDA